MSANKARADVHLGSILTPRSSTKTPATRSAPLLST